MIGRFYTWKGGIWRVLVRGEPFDRGPRRNVLLERFDHVAWDFPTGRPIVHPTGERVVRPFRGLRRWRPRWRP